MISNQTEPLPPHARPGTSLSHRPATPSSHDGVDGFISEPEYGRRTGGPYGRAQAQAPPPLPPPPPLPNGGFVPLAPAAGTGTFRHRRGSSTGDGASSSSKFKRRLSATLGTLSSFGSQSHPHAHAHAEPARWAVAAPAKDGAGSESEGAGATLRVGAQFVRKGSRRGRAIPPGLLADDTEELDIAEEQHALPIFGRMLSGRNSRSTSKRPATTGAVSRSSVDRADLREATLPFPTPSGPSSRASSTSGSAYVASPASTAAASSSTAALSGTLVPDAVPTARPRPSPRDRQAGANKRLSVYLSQKFSEVGFGSHGYGIGHGVGLPPDLEREEAAGVKQARAGTTARDEGADRAGGKLLRPHPRVPHRRQTDGGAPAVLIKPSAAEPARGRPSFAHTPSNDSGLLLADLEMGVEVSELAKWGGPAQVQAAFPLPSATGTYSSESSLASRHRYPASTRDREAYFEFPTVSQRTLLGTQDHSKQGVMSLLGIGCDPLHAVRRRAPRRGLGDRVVSQQVPRTGQRSEAATIVPMPYAVGYEQETLDMEAMLLDSVASLRSGTHTSYPSSEPPPQRVLDIGTGLGLWPIQQAKTWTEAEFIGLDIVPVQVDLDRLARHQKAKRSEALVSDQTVDSAGIDWAELKDRIKWQLGDFLQPLPFDTGTFDMVRISFCGLAIPEPSWPEVIDEAARVLKRYTGILEVIDSTYVPPLSFPRSRQFSYDNLLRTSFIHALPYTQIRAALAISGLSSKQVLNHRMRRRAAVVPDADFVITSGVDVWIESALGWPAKRSGADMGAYGRSLASAAVGLTSDDSGDEITERDAELEQRRDASDDIILMAWICEKR